MCCFLKCCSLLAVPTLLYTERSRAFKAGHQRKLEPKKWDCSSINTHFRYFPHGPLEVTRSQNKAQDRTGLTSTEGAWGETSSFLTCEIQVLVER